MTDQLRSPKRNRFFSGRLLRAEDFELEQDYFREKLKRHNRYLHGFGVVFGLEVSRSSDEVHVSPGLALDCTGNEIVVAESIRLLLPRPEDSGPSIFLSVRYIEELDGDPTSVKSDEKLQIKERVGAVFEEQNANAGHRHAKGRWLTCGKSHGLTIARLRFSTGQWRIDHRYHPPAVK